jgi:hypothetical protein
MVLFSLFCLDLTGSNQVTIFVGVNDIPNLSVKSVKYLRYVQLASGCVVCCVSLWWSELHVCCGVFCVGVLCCVVWWCVV